MTKFKYFKLSPTKRIRYLNHAKRYSDYIVFLHGFMSDLEGKKPKLFLDFAKKKILVFLLLNTQVMVNLLESLSMGIFLNGAKRPRF